MITAEYGFWERFRGMDLSLEVTAVGLGGVVEEGDYGDMNQYAKHLDSRKRSSLQEAFD